MRRISYWEASKKFIVCNENKMFITVFTIAWDRLVQSTRFHAISVTSVVILSFHLGIVLPSDLFTSTSFTIPSTFIFFIDFRKQRTSKCIIGRVKQEDTARTDKLSRCTCLSRRTHSFYRQSKSNKSPSRCNNFPVYYPDAYLELNIFRGVLPPIIRSSMTAVAASGFTFVSWW